MNRDKKILYALSSILLFALLLIFFIPSQVTRIITAVILVAFVVFINMFVKKKFIYSINSKQVLMIMSVISLVYIVIFYLTGTRFGFYQSIYRFSWTTIGNYIIPLSLSMICSQLISSRLLDQKNKIVNLLVFFILLSVDLLMFSNFSEITTFNRFMEAVGKIFIPSISRTCLFIYLNKQYGPKPSIIFALVTNLYQYIIPFVPATPDAFKSVGKMLTPIAIYWFINFLYAKKQKKASKASRNKWRYVGYAATLAVMIGITGLVSNQFSYGIIVIATGSMTGELNKGDALIFKEYTTQIIQEQQIILFKKNGSTIVHRVVDIKSINGDIRYYTKGDANESNDDGFIYSSDIIGVGVFKIPYIGYPSIWVRDIFSK